VSAEKFELWAVGQGFNTASDGHGFYHSYTTQQAWLGWKAACNDPLMIAAPVLFSALIVAQNELRQCDYSPASAIMIQIKQALESAKP
jgi:hypothetical protein